MGYRIWGQKTLTRPRITVINKYKRIQLKNIEVVVDEPWTTPAVKCRDPKVLTVSRRRNPKLLPPFANKKEPSPPKLENLYNIRSELIGKICRIEYAYNFSKLKTEYSLYTQTGECSGVLYKDNKIEHIYLVGHERDPHREDEEILSVYMLEPHEELIWRIENGI